MFCVWVFTVSLTTSALAVNRLLLILNYFPLSGCAPRPRETWRINKLQLADTGHLFFRQTHKNVKELVFFWYCVLEKFYSVGCLDFACFIMTNYYS